MIFKPQFNLNSQRLIFQRMSEKAPRAPEHFKKPEKASYQEIAAEVAPMTPGQIAAGSVSAGTVVTNQNIQNTQAMANLINDPLISEPLPSTPNTSNETT